MNVPGLKELLTIALVVAAFAVLWRLAQRRRRPTGDGGKPTGLSAPASLPDGPAADPS